MWDEESEEINNRILSEDRILCCGDRYELVNDGNATLEDRLCEPGT